MPHQQHTMMTTEKNDCIIRKDQNLTMTTTMAMTTSPPRASSSSSLLSLSSSTLRKRGRGEVVSLISFFSIFILLDCYGTRKLHILSKRSNLDDLVGIVPFKEEDLIDSAAAAAVYQSTARARTLYNNKSTPQPSYEKQNQYNLLEDPWTTERFDKFESFYEVNKTGDKLKVNADEEGPVLDFLISGWPKCGTTTLEANLGHYAPMPIADVCVPLHPTVYYAYHNWPKQFDPNGTKPLRGSKCPSYVDNAVEINKHLPKTKLILGIRHPISVSVSLFCLTAIHPFRSISTLIYHY